MREINFSELDTCAITGKKCLTNAQATELIRIYKRKSQLRGGKRIPTRAYFCYECGWWHVTSQKHSGERRYDKRWL